MVSAAAQCQLYATSTPKAETQQATQKRPSLVASVIAKQLGIARCSVYEALKGA
jgi:GTP-sensing pleiotropic transcriptional regulator CodY